MAAPKIAKYYDGDTVRITDTGKDYKLRITNIDAPERNQPYGKKSRRALMQFCKDADIQVIITGTDKYERQLGKLYCNQEDISLLMVKNGHAWFYKQYSNDATLAYAEKTAKLKKLGLWENKRQTPPWVWRRNHRLNYGK